MRIIGASWKKRSQKETRWGFNTNRNTKVAIIKYMEQCVRDKLWIERETGMIKELGWYMKYPNGKYGALAGKHDDRVMSRAIGLYVSRFEWDRYPVRVLPTMEEKMNNMKRLNRSATGAEAILYKN